MLTDTQGEMLLKIARENIRQHLVKKGTLGQVERPNLDWLDQNAAVFVTLNLHGQLRGCIGSMIAYRSLFDDVISHSYNAAFKDPRFSPVSPAEFDHLEIEISVLTPMQEVSYTSYKDLKTKITPLIDGIYLTGGSRSATFLPQVWEQLPDFDDFFAHLCYKAGLPSNFMLNAHPKIEKYQVQKFKEIK